MSFSNFFDMYMRGRFGEQLQRGGVEFRYAATALLLACSNADLDESDEEKEAIRELVKSTFKISDRGLDRVFEFAYSSQEGSYLEEMAALIDEGFPAEDKQFILIGLWKVALADGHIDQSEEDFIVRVAAAIGMTTQNVQDARQKAEQESGQSL